MWLLITLVLSIVLAICILIRRKKQRNYVNTYSTKLSTIKELNKKYNFDHKFKRNFSFQYYLDTKRKFDNFRYMQAVRNSFILEQASIKNSLVLLTIDKIAFKEYKEEIAKISDTDIKLLPKVRYINKKSFKKVEKKLIVSTVLAPNLDISIKVKWSYTSPKGQSHYERALDLEYDDMVLLYKEYFDIDLTRIEENNRIEQAMEVVKKSMVDVAYSASQISGLFKNMGIKADEKLIATTAWQAGFWKQKRSEIYIRKANTSISEMILASANSDGLIRYNNLVKNDEYDQAISKLEKSGKIVPISSLSFLKIDQNLNYDGITLDEINHFFDELSNFADNHKYISVKTITEGIDSKITKSDYEECFIYSLVKNSGILTEIPCLNKLFTKSEDANRLGFLTSLMVPHKSKNAFDLILEIKDKYDVDYNIYSIIYDIDKGKTKLYYNSETEKLYSDKEYFYEEIL